MNILKGEHERTGKFSKQSDVTSLVSQLTAWASNREPFRSMTWTSALNPLDYWKTAARLKRENTRGIFYRGTNDREISAESSAKDTEYTDDQLQEETSEKHGVATGGKGKCRGRNQTRDRKIRLGLHLNIIWAGETSGENGEIKERGLGESETRPQCDHMKIAINIWRMSTAPLPVPGIFVSSLYRAEYNHIA
ncbi:hypothetical protein B0H14DRAFT_2627992 [Mycena olivaceomarginata]|nr:hypothetical protein B0H14DRAFT_2627992 [Mycena olivaceomarginata]